MVVSILPPRRGTFPGTPPGGGLLPPPPLAGGCKGLAGKDFLGEMYLGTGQLDDSEKHLRHAIAVGGDFPDARKLMVELAAAYGTAGKPLRSVAVIETTIQSLPNNPSVAAERDELHALLEQYRQSSCQAPRDTASSCRA